MSEGSRDARQSRRFGPSALVVELNSLLSRVKDSGDSSVLEVLSHPMRDRFTLTEGQERELGALEQDKEAIGRLRSLVEENARAATPGSFVVTLRPDASSTSGFSHELCLERPSGNAPEAARAVGGGTQTTSLRIAHCDADCDNWGWG